MPILANLNKATATNFELVFPLLPVTSTLNEIKPLSINIFGTVIPSLSLDETEQRWQGAKMYMHSGLLNYDTWNISFVVDSKLSNWILLQKWVIFINNNKDIPSRKPTDYMIDASLNITDNFTTQVATINFKNTWIQSLGEVTLNQRDGESILESNATLRYDRFEITEIT